MTMKHKLIITLILLATVPMAISVTISTWVAREAGWQALVAETEQRLISERENKKGQLETVFEIFKNQADPTFQGSSRFIKEQKKRLYQKYLHLF